MRHGMSCSEAGKLGGKKSIAITLIKYKNRINLYNLIPKKCIECDKSLDYEKRYNKFCSHTCAAISNNKGRRTVKVIKYCKTCNTEFFGSLDRKFCSQKCMGIFRHKQTFSKHILNHRNLRTYWLEITNKCSICGLDSWMNKSIPLVLDHIDGNSDNNTKDNTRLICCNCDAQTDTYKSKNRGHGRYSRRLRYRQGKSY